MIEFLKQPWPWYIAGPLIGLTVPLLLIVGNKSFGISSSFRHVCAACIASKIPFFSYDWKKEIWNLVFVAGIILGGLITYLFLQNPNELVMAPSLSEYLTAFGIDTNPQGYAPLEIFSWEGLITTRGFIMIVIGGFLVGFGTRYAGGCTSGHAIMGISNLQWPSVIATIFFMIGGLVMTHYILPYILNL
ncbi:MAG: YeeE/YedE family protein [Weeksellaceae bacterium]